MEIEDEGHTVNIVAGPTGAISAASRWVAKTGNSVPRTPHGLLKGDSLVGDRYADQGLRRASELHDLGSYTLLAQGQSGKTTLFGELHAGDPGSALIDLRMFTGEPIADVVRNQGRGHTSVYLDSLDEALRADPNAAFKLSVVLRDSWAQGVRWRIACRPGFWDPDIVRDLDVTELELLPLHEDAVTVLAGHDAPAFLSAVTSHSLSRLLALPGQARSLLGHWQELQSLPASGAESMKHTITSLLVEQRSLGGRGQVQTVEQLRVLAEHLAALAVFCALDHFTTSGGGATSPAVLSAAQVSTPPGAGNQASAFDAEKVREVLDTSLFSAAGRGTLSFAHQSYTDYLAASYLKRHNISGKRLVSLLGAGANGLVPAAMQEVLSWLLAIGASVPSDLTRHNAKELLRASGLELTNDSARGELVAAVLGLAAERIIDEGWGINTSHLAHPQIAQQLREALDSADNKWTVFWVCRLARQCVVHDFAGDLLKIAKDDQWPDTVRAEAINGLAVISPPPQISDLGPLLDLPADQDPRDEILAATLRALIPNGLPAATIARALRAPHGDHYVGGYQFLLTDLDKVVRASDALTILAAILPKAKGRAHAHVDAAVRLMSLMWSKHDAQQVTELGALLGSHLNARSLAPRPAGLPWETDQNIDLRRTMGFAALGASDRADLVVSRLRMLLPEDLDWLLDKIGELDQPADGAVALLLRDLAFNVSSAATADRILALPESHPAYQALESTRGLCLLEQRPDWYEPKLSPEVREHREQHLAELREQLQAAANDHQVWPQVVTLLADPEAVSDELGTWDLTQRSYWTRLTAEERVQVVEVGLDYVQQASPTLERWADADSWLLDDVMPDWSAVFLLATLAVHWPQIARKDPADMWVRWVPAAVAVPNFRLSNGTDEPGRWLLEAMDLGDEIRTAFSESMRDRIRLGQGTEFEGHTLTDLSDASIYDAISSVARDQSQPTKRREAAHRVLVQQQPESALDIALEVFDTEIDCPPEAIATIGRFAPVRIVQPWMNGGGLGPEAHIATINTNLLARGELVWLAMALLDRYPFSSDPDSNGGGASHAENARRCRNRCLQIMVERGLVTELESMLVGRDEVDHAQIRHFLYLARITQTTSNWRPLQVSELMSILATGEARLVRGPGDLLEVLRELLDEFQHEIHQRGAYRDVWDGEPRTGDKLKSGEARPKPKSEDAVSDRVQRFLESRLATVAVDRELQVTRKSEHGIGTRIDLTLTAPGKQFLSRVLVEAKHIANGEVMTAIDEQLAARYLQALGLTHGLFLVYWIAPRYRTSGPKAKFPDPQALQAELQEQADLLKRKHLHIDVYVLDIGPAT